MCKRIWRRVSLTVLIASVCREAREEEKSNVLAADRRRPSRRCPALTVQRVESKVGRHGVGEWWTGVYCDGHQWLESMLGRETIERPENEGRTVAAGREGLGQEPVELNLLAGRARDGKREARRSLEGRQGGEDEGSGGGSKHDAADRSGEESG